MGRKAKRIQELEVQVASQRAELDRSRQTERLVEETRINLGMAALESGDIGADAEEAIVKGVASLEVFDSFPAELRWQKLFELFGDGIIRQALESRRQYALEHARSELQHDNMFEEARLMGRLDTRKLLEGDRLRLGVYRKGIFKGTDYDHRLSDLVRRDISNGTINLLAEGESLFRVIDASVESYGASYDGHLELMGHIEPNSVIRLGNVTNDGEKKLDPFLYKGTPVGFSRGESVYHFGPGDLLDAPLLGAVLVNGQAVLEPLS